MLYGQPTVYHQPFSADLAVAQSDIYDILENELAYARYAGTSTSTQNSSNLSYHGMNPETMTSIVLI